MRAKFINEIKQNKEGSALGSIGIGRVSVLKGYNILKKLDNFNVNTTLSDAFNEIKTKPSFIEEGYEKPINMFEQTINEIIDSHLDDLAVISNIEMAKYRVGSLKNMFNSSIKWTEIMIPSINGNIFGQNWVYQILFNNIYKVGYIEFYKYGYSISFNYPSLYYYFVKYK